jgi:hypothetical protein
MVNLETHDEIDVFLQRFYEPQFQVIPLRSPLILTGMTTLFHAYFPKSECNSHEGPSELMLGGRCLTIFLLNKVSSCLTLGAYAHMAC